MYTHERNLILMFLHICWNCETALINCLIVLIIFVCGIVVLFAFVVQQGLAVRQVQMDLTLLSLSIKVFDFDFDFHKHCVLVFTNVYDFVHFQWLKTPMWKAKQGDIFCLYMAINKVISCVFIWLSKVISFAFIWQDITLFIAICHLVYSHIKAKDITLLSHIKAKISPCLAI